jgi:hypothetical protein
VIANAEASLTGGTFDAGASAKGSKPKNILATASSGVNFDNFELFSNGPDGKADTEDDIIMRDGIFYTYEESKKRR